MYETVALFTLKDGLEEAVRFIKMEILPDEPIEGGLELLKPVDDNDVAFTKDPGESRRVTVAKVPIVALAFSIIALSLKRYVPFIGWLAFSGPLEFMAVPFQYIVKFESR
jgi:hypothetical protein